MTQICEDWWLETGDLSGQRIASKLKPVKDTQGLITRAYEKGHTQMECDATQSLIEK
jgi:hypothetical protein